MDKEQGGDISGFGLLPGLRPDQKSVSPPVEVGNWESREGFDFLGELAQALETGVVDRSLEDLISVPDCWAHPLVFRHAWADQTHPLHDGAVAQWRGLLALFALQYRYSDRYAVHIDVLELASLSQRSSPSTLFGWVLGKVKPAEVLCAGLSWDRVGLIRCNGVLVGLMLPTTLVCPLRGEIKGRGITRVPWVQDGRFVDPLDSGVLVGAEYAALTAYLDHLSQELDAAKEAEGWSNRLGNPMIANVDRFRAAADEARQDHDGAEPEAFERFPLSASVPQGVLYPALIQVPRPHRDEEIKAGAATDVLLALPAPLAHAINGAVLLPPGRTDSLDPRPTRPLRYWREHSVDRVRASDELYADLARDMVAEGYLPVRAEDLFTPRLVRLADGIQTPGNPRDFQNYLLPLTPLALMLLEPAEIRERLSLNGTTAMLKLNLTKGADDNPVTCTVAHTYAASECVTLAPPTELGLWPDIRSADWTDYFIFEERSGDEIGRQLRLALVLSRPVLDRRIKALTEAAGHMDVAGINQQLVYRHPEIGQVYSDDNNRIFQSLGQVDGVPETLIFTANEAYAGAALLPDFKPVDPTATRRQVGLDYGTVSTCIHYRDGDNPPRRLAFRGHNVDPFPRPRDQRRQDLLEQHFLPPRGSEVPFRSILRQRNMVQGAESLVMRRFHAYMPSSAFGGVSRLTLDRGGSYFPSVKWADTSEGRQQIAAFLNQIVTMVGLECVADGIAMNNIEWNVTYPEAFNAEKRRDFQEELGKAVARIGGVPPAPDHFISESAAAAAYFRRAVADPVAFSSHVLVFDIGGHSTDISIWHGEKCLWRGSLECGGQDVTTLYFLNNIKVLRKFDRNAQGGRRGFAAGAIVELLDQIIASDNDGRDVPGYRTLTGRAPAGVEIVLNSDEFREIWAEEIQRFTPDLKPLKRANALFFGGLLWYVGRVFRHLERQGRVPTQASGNLQICIAGRGCDALERFFPVGTQEGFRSMFVAASGYDGHIGDFNFSRVKKAEASYGATFSRADEPMLAAEPCYTANIVGEKLTTGKDEEIAPEAPLDEKAYGAGLWVANGLPEFSKFREAFDHFFADELPWDQRIGAKVEDHVNSALDKLIVQARRRSSRRRPADKDIEELRYAQPAFILVVREYLRLMINRNWSGLG